MLQFKRWLITITSLLVIIAGLGFVKFSQIKAAIAFGESFPEASETVEATTAQWSDFQPTVTLMGELKSPRSVDLRNEVEGILITVGAGSGAKVQKGDVIAQFNIDTEVAQLEAINASIELAKLEVKRFADLLDARASSKEQLDRAKAQLAVSQAQARGIEATIAKKTVLAPFTGYTSIHDWQVGTYLPVSTIIINITGEDEALWIDFNLPQIYANITIGTLLEVGSTVETNAPVLATLVALNQQLDTRSRTLQARAQINTPPKLMRPGMVVSVTLPVGELVRAIPLPNQAIRYDTFGSYVYVLTKDENDNLRAQRKPVNVSSKQAELTYVTGGIEANDVVATVGSAKLLPNLLTFVRQ